MGCYDTVRLYGEYGDGLNYDALYIPIVFQLQYILRPKNGDFTMPQFMMAKMAMN